MDPFNPIDTEPLRSTDLMIAYLEDRAEEEDILRIEELMESDSLYRLSMEELADQITVDPVWAKKRIEKTTADFEEALDAAKSHFINHLTNAAEISDKTASPGPAIPWWSYLVGIALIAALAWTYLSFQNNVNFHKPPLQNLTITTDEGTLSKFLDDCGERPIGRQKSENTSVYSALVEQFAQEKYKAAAHSFETLSKTLPVPCQSFAAFYKGHCYLGIKDLTKAEKAFEEVLRGAENQLKLKHAAQWYLANLKLARGADTEAKTHLEALAKSDKEKTKDHISQLLEDGYLIDVQKYLNKF